MVKFLKFLLLVIVIAFAFALGVRFSDSFKGTIGSFKDDEIKVQNEMDKAFDDIKKEVSNNDVSVENSNPLTEEEKNEVNNTAGEMSDYANIEIVEPMDGVSDTNIQVETTTQNVENSNNQTDNVVPSQGDTSTQPVQITTESTQAPVQPAPVAPTVANQNTQQAPAKTNTAIEK